MTDSSHPPTFEAPDPAVLSALFPGYDIDILIATGGMGAVYRAVQRSLDRVVAIKILPREFGADPAFRESFEAEAKAMAKLNHPNLIGVFDFGEVDGMLFIIMEFVPGGSLYHFAYGKTLDGILVGQLIEAVCDGLAHAHQHGVLHRDIKPANILLDAHGRPKIGDFGLARVIGKQVEAGETVYGTPHYTAPEVINHPASVDARADVFSVGVMLHELLTTKLPAKDPRPPSVISGSDLRFDAIVKRATNPVVDLRYPSAAAMGKDIKVVVDALTAAKVRASAAPAANRPAGRPLAAAHPAAAAATPNRQGPRIPAPVPTSSRKSDGGGMVIVVLLILAAAAAAYFLTRKPQRPAPPPQSALEYMPKSLTQEPTPTKSPEITRPEKKPPRHDEFAPRDRPQDDFHKPDPDLTKGPEDKGPPVIGTPEIVPTPAVSTFDIEAFLKKARDIMVAKAQSNVLKHEDGLKSNIDDLDRALKRAARRLDYDRDAVEKWIEDSLAIFRNNGNRISENYNAKDITQVREIFEKYLAEQAKLDAKLSAELRDYSRTYILGIELQIKRLKTQNDETAAQTLADEVSATAADSTHFETLILGGPVIPLVVEPKHDDKRDERRPPPP